MSTRPDRIQKLKHQMQQLKARIAATEAQDFAARKEKTRSEEAMKKRVLGKIMYDILSSEKAPSLLRFLDQMVHKQDDRSLFGLAARPDDLMVNHQP